MIDQLVSSARLGGLSVAAVREHAFRTQGLCNMITKTSSELAYCAQIIYLTSSVTPITEHRQALLPLQVPHMAGA
jgi:hypothetical protein